MKNTFLQVIDLYKPLNGQLPPKPRAINPNIKPYLSSISSVPLMYFNDLKKLSDKTPTVFSILKYFSMTLT